MSWIEQHEISEKLASQAQQALNKGRREEALRLIQQCGSRRRKGVGRSGQVEIAYRRHIGGKHCFALLQGGQVGAGERNCSSVVESSKRYRRLPKSYCEAF